MITMMEKIFMIWRMYDMYKNTMSVVKGIGAGMAVGIAAGVVGATVLGNKKKVKKHAHKAMHAVGDLLGNVPYMFK